MDLLATVRKEGSRGGTGDFKWSDVQNSSHREHYLGHSLHAPVGRWAKNRDPNWFVKGDSEETKDSAENAARERAAEIKRIKEAEEDALSRALGLPVPVRSNPNMEALGERKELDKMLKEATNEDGGATGGKGIGYGGLAGAVGGQPEKVERIEGNVEQQDKELQYALNEYRRRHGGDKRGNRSRSRSRDQDRRPRRHRSREHRHRRRSSSRDRHHRRTPASREGDYESQRDGKYRDRSRSPRRKHDRRDHRDERRR
jgi:Multiple myeloma tumor-associated